MSLPDDELRNKVEALLFSVGKRIDVSEIAKHVKCKDMEQLDNVLKQIKSEYDLRSSPMIIVNDGTHWKIVVREKYTPVVKKVVADIELSRTLMETLAMVAWKNPCKQSEIIEIRSNKGYDHLDELERIGFITRKKFGRTKLISLTEKFFNYFELSGHGDIKEAFKKIKELEERKLQEYAAKRAERDMYRRKMEEVQVINEKAFLAKIEKKLNVNDDEQKTAGTALESEVWEVEKERAANSQSEGPVEKIVEESDKEQELGEEEESKENYDEKLDEEGMPNLDEDIDDEEEKPKTAKAGKK